MDAKINKSVDAGEGLDAANTHGTDAKRACCFSL